MDDFKYLCLHNKEYNGEKLDVKAMFLSRGWDQIDLRPHLNDPDPNLSEETTWEVWVKGYNWHEQAQRIKEKYSTLLFNTTDKKEKEKIIKQYDEAKNELSKREKESLYQ